MCVSSLRTLLLIVFLSGLSALSQETVVRIGVATLRSGTNKISAVEARDRLAKNLSHQKLDKKHGLSIQTVALEASQNSEALAEAKAKDCQFLLLSWLTDLVNSEHNVATDMQGSMNTVPVVAAKVRYSLIRVTDGVEYGVGSTNGPDSSSMQDAVLQAMGPLASEVAAVLKKGGNVPLPAPVAESKTPPSPISSVTPSPISKKGEITYFGPDLCKWLPTDLAHADALRGVCDYAISLPQRMPNFICDQRTSRYRGENTVPRDLITALVRYEDGNESYSEIKLNGKPAPSAITGSPGLWSTGEFGSNLRAIFDPRNTPIFEFVGEKARGGHAAWVFTYIVVRQNDPLWRLRTEDAVLAPPYDGELWVDQKTGGLLRFRMVAEDIPPTFPMQSAELLTDYDNVTFADGTAFVLPIEATVATKYRGQELTRNVLQFNACRKFRAKARMLLDVPLGVAEGSAPRGTVTSADLERQLEENNQILAILREQAIRDDQSRLDLERKQEMDAATGITLSRLSEMEKRRQKIAEEQARTLATAVSSPVTPPPVGSSSKIETVLRVSVKFVPVTVVLRDLKGNAVGDLRKEDFQLFDNGKPQAITHFSVEKSTSQEGKQAAEKTAEHAELPSQPAVRPIPDRYVAYVFDDIHAVFEDLNGARDAAVRHLAGLRPQDRAAVFTTSGQVGLDFTADRDKLNQALRALRPHPVVRGAECPPVSFYMADLIINQSDLDALGMATKDALSCAFGGLGTSANDLARAERIAKTTAMQVLSASDVENQSTLGILRDVLRRTATAPGTRSIVLVSPGFLLVGPETRGAIMDLTDDALRSEIIVNTLDVRGLYTPVAPANQSHPSDPVLRFRYDREEASQREEVMANLAYSTGGTFFHNNNDMDEGFRKTADAPEYIYVLGFSPQKLDGKLHKLKVSLNSGAPRLTIQAREGYYALKPASNQ